MGGGRENKIVSALRIRHEGARQNRRKCIIEFSIGILFLHFYASIRSFISFGVISSQ